MKLRRGLPLLVLVVLLVVVPLVEVWLLIQVDAQIGGWWLLAILLAEVVVGAWLMRREGARAWQALTMAFGSGRVPTGELADAALVLVGGVLLILPGFATDLIGFLFLLPMTRPLARRMVAFFIARRVNRAAQRRTTTPDGVVIPGEVVDQPNEIAPDMDRPSDPDVTSAQDRKV